MTKFKDENKYYEGSVYKLYITEPCLLGLKKSGVFLRVLARLKKVCDTDHFGQEKIGYNYLEDENIGWFKWNKSLLL